MTGSGAAPPDAPDGRTPSPRGSGLAAVVGLGAICALALFVRAGNFAKVFRGGDIVFAAGDGLYRVRRALYTFVEFPKVLFFDPYLNHPDGATIPLSPLLDVLVGSTAFLLASDERGFELVAAWTNPVLGALTVLPLYAAARSLASRGVSLAAAALFAVLPVAVLYARLGNVDHHAAVGLLGACALLVCMRLLDPGASHRRIAGLAIALGITRAALLWTYHGSLLHLALIDGVVLIGAALGGWRAVFAAEAGSALLTLALVAPGVLFVLPPPLGGPYSAIALSKLHLLALAALAIASVSGIGLVGTTTRSTAARVASVAGVGVALVGAIAVVPGVREGLEPALRFLTKTDAVGARVLEQLPLYRVAGNTGWGLLAWAIPLMPIVAVGIARDPSRRAAALVLAAWTAFFGVLTVAQRRYGNDLAASGCIAIALGGAAIARAAADRMGLERRSAAAALILAAPLLLLGPIRDQYLPWLCAARAKLSGEEHSEPLDVFQSLHRFAAQVRAATPETAGFLAPDEAPAYGIAAPANLGHALHYVARRATPADPFWAFIGPENWRRNQRLLDTTDEDEALAMAAALRARYVVVTPGRDLASVAGRLFAGDGRASAQRPPLSRFRLVTEGPAGGAGLAGRRLADDGAPYKLFEIVEGAVLEVEAAPGTPVLASVGIVTETGRSFRYATRAVAGGDGVARLRVPYASGRNGPTRASGRWSLRVGNRPPCRASTSEDDVLLGRTVRVECPGEQKSFLRVK